MKKSFLLSFAFLACFGLFAQQIQNVTAEQQGKNIVVSYDLTATSGEFDVSLYCSTDGGSNFGNPLNAVAGDVGRKVIAGTNKQITWNVLSDMEKLTGSRIVFEVRARTTSDLGIEMVFVKGGTFNMGSNDGESVAKLTHQVTLSDFYIGKCEVTQKQWQDIMGSNPSNFKNCDNCPVEQVSWYDVQEFIKKLNEKTGKNYRLPTEAEWEYAARGGASASSATATKYSGSNNLDEVAWYDGNSGNKTHPVGQKKPNELGIYDMSGNVWEWCNDWYGKYSNDSQTNPQGASSSSFRVLRGGSWLRNDGDYRVSSRGSSMPIYRKSHRGFRLALVP
jgi:sulfatase modifying factor 1